MIEFGAENKLKYAPFLIEAFEGQDNEIKFIVSLAIRSGNDAETDSYDNSKLYEMTSQYAQICKDDKNTYEIIFDNYVFHMIRNESYTSFKSNEIRRGNYFIIFERSFLLDNIQNLIDRELVMAVNNNQYKHYGIYCQNHIIDIISTNEPIIRLYNKNTL